MGAGKTTAILNMAKRFMLSGKKVGIVTNDQGSQLVDAHFLRANGLETLSVEGGCFCCKFHDFSKKVAELQRSQAIDAIFAEPVGSCTDLVATVFRPILYGKLPAAYAGVNESPPPAGSCAKGISLAPLSIVADPKRIKRFMMQETGGGGEGEGGETFPTEVNYLFEKQLQEADIIAINKCDLLSGDEYKRIYEYMKARYPGSEILGVSAKTGEGLAEWMEFIGGNVSAADKVLQIDYDAYARAEAALGWLNAVFSLTSDRPADINEKVRKLLFSIKATASVYKAEIAHIKCYCVSQNEYYKASLTGVGDGLDEDAAMSLPHKEVNLILNARAHIDPEPLKRICEEAVRGAFPDFNIADSHIEHFKPSPPNPTFRTKGDGTILSSNGIR